MRLRQAVVAAADRDAVVDTWTRELALGEPFHDPEVKVFGLGNAVVPVGDTFLEVVSPLVPGDGCAAERFMARNGGDCGYMAIFQVDDIDAARDHLDASGLRRVLDIDRDDMCGTHVHPADIGGAIVSFDQAVPPSSWRWAGPAWADRSRTGVATGLAGIELASRDAPGLLERWAAALAVVPDGGTLTLPDGTYVRFTGTGEPGRTGLVGIDLWAAPGGAERSFAVAGVVFRLVAPPAPRDVA